MSAHPLPIVRVFRAHLKAAVSPSCRFSATASARVWNLAMSNTHMSKKMVLRSPCRWMFALSFCLSIGLIPKPVPIFGSDALGHVQAPDLTQNRCHPRVEPEGKLFGSATLVSTDAHVSKAAASKVFRPINIAQIDHDRRLQAGLDPIEVQRAKRIPFRHNDERIGILHG